MLALYQGSESTPSGMVSVVVLKVSWRPWSPVYLRLSEYPKLVGGNAQRQESIMLYDCESDSDAINIGEKYLRHWVHVFSDVDGDD